MTVSIPTISSRTKARNTAPANGREVYSTVIATPLPLPHLGIRCTNGHITELRFLPATIPLHSVSTADPDAELIRQLVDRLVSYFRRPNTSFTAPLRASGTPFQQRVWQAIGTIPSGETRSYAFLASALATSPRAIGGACRANPLPLLVPCHRVIAANGGNGGFLGQAPGQGMSTDIKAWLLAHERP